MNLLANDCEREDDGGGEDEEEQGGGTTSEVWRAASCSEEKRFLLTSEVLCLSQWCILYMALVDSITLMALIALVLSVHRMVQKYLILIIS